MKREENKFTSINSISELHNMMGLPKPHHPMISVVKNCDVKISEEEIPTALSFNFYKISYLENLQGKVKYGQSHYDFNEGGMVFISPNQIMIPPDKLNDYQGMNIFIHPDFFLNYSLASKIKTFGFFSYATNEALHLSDQEKSTVLSVFKDIDDEVKSRIDNFSQDVVISQLELLLNYSNRFYNRQFITRKAVSNDLLTNLENLLIDCFNSEKIAAQGVPTVQFLAEHLKISPSYLSDMLRTLTGRNAQQHIHEKLIGKAKEKLTTTNLSVSEIAYELGFEHSQSFSKLFKKKTDMTPMEFKHSFK